MFPESYDPDSLLLQLSCVFSVTMSVFLDFRFPEVAVGSWNVAALRAPVPEASVYEHSDPVVREEEVRIPWYSLGTYFPSPYSRPDCHEPKLDFGGLVTLPPDRTHGLRSDRRHAFKSAVFQFLAEVFFHAMLRTRWLLFLQTNRLPSTIALRTSLLYNGV